jgi:hypothetical protein
METWQLTRYLALSLGFQPKKVSNYHRVNRRDHNTADSQWFCADGLEEEGRDCAVRYMVRYIYKKSANPFRLTPFNSML